MMKSRRVGWAGGVAPIGERKIVHRLLVVKPEGKRLLVRPRHRWVDSIKLDLEETRWGGMDWIDLHDRDR
jgi:hypothetical protein